MVTIFPIVKDYMVTFGHIGKRLREERKRLDLNQTEFSAFAQLNRRTQANYEKGTRYPDAAYLAAIAVEGADVQYIITGIRSTVESGVSEHPETYSASEMEQQLLTLYRGMTQAQRRQLLEIARVLGGGRPL